MEQIAFDLTAHYPLVEPPDYCNGTVSLHGANALVNLTLHLSTALAHYLT